MDDLLAIIGGLQIIEWKLAIGWSWANQGIFLVDLIHLGVYKMFELDIHMLLAIKMIEWIKCLKIKFELDKFIRWHLVSGLNGYMSCESIQTS